LNAGSATGVILATLFALCDFLTDHSDEDFSEGFMRENAVDQRLFLEGL
jgi:hypothetical protein